MTGRKDEVLAIIARYHRVHGRGPTVRQIAEQKMKDLSANDVEAAMKIIMGSAKSVGIEVKG